MTNRNKLQTHVIAAAASASDPEASDPNLYMSVKILILPLARCIVVPVDFTTMHCFRAGQSVNTMTVTGQDCRASKAADSNLCMRVKTSILPSTRYIPWYGVASNALKFSGVL